MLGRSRTRFRLRHRGALIPPADGHGVASFSVGPAGEVVVLWTGGAAAAITIHTSAVSLDAITLREPPPAFPAAQPLPGGQLLVVGTRAAWRDGVTENNAHVYGADGALERVGCLGDGIEHVQALADGSIWVGYFDEGIYGNNGWGLGTGPRPIGEPGIVRFSPGLEVEWEYSRDDDSTDLELIDDCYALNVAGDDAWACCYSDFAVLRIREGSVRSWSNEVTGARAIVVSGDVVALFGGYDKDRDRLVVADLDEDELAVETTGRLTMPNGRRLPQDAVVVGRGDELHVLVGLEWFTWSLTERT